MTDFIGRPLAIGDYVFGSLESSPPRIWEIVGEITEEKYDNHCWAVESGNRSTFRLRLSVCLKLSKEEMTHYLLQRGIKR